MLTVAEETLTAIGKKRGLDIHVQPLRPGDQPRDLRDLQGRHADQGEGENADHIVGGARVVHAGARRLPAGIRLHGRQPALREELEEGPGGDGRQGRHARPRFRSCTKARSCRSSPAQRRPDALLGQHGLEDEPQSALGSRIAEVHNGSSLFTGDAGQGESNIRRWLIENDWVEAMVALPLNLFYNTGIATYVWVLSNRKPQHRGRCSSSMPRQWFKPLRKNLGKKNCELGPDDISASAAPSSSSGNAGVEDLANGGLRLLEGHRRAPLRPAQPTVARPSRPCVCLG